MGEQNHTNPGQPFRGSVVINYSGGDQSLSVYSRGIYIGTAGALKVDFVDGTTVTLANLAAGAVYDFAVKKIYQAGSSAAGHVLL